ncbi:MAG: 3-isopropylmalate dehydratase small subunit [Candidatus Thermoplasmatota archaeon]
MKKTRGRAWKFGDNIDTDQIYPGKYLPITDKKEMGKHAMEGLEGYERFIKGVAKGDILVAGKNFGCGSSREHAPLSLKFCGISGIIAESFARIFYRNCINVGMPILECDTSSIEDGNILEVNFLKGEVKNLSKTKNKLLLGKPLSELEFKIMKAGGVIEYLKAEEK